MKQEFRVEVRRVHCDHMDYGPLARHLLDRIIEFYEDPENVKAYEEWKKKRDAEKAGQ